MRDLLQRVERLEAQQGQAPVTFMLLGATEADELAWRSVSDGVKADLRRQFELCGPYAVPWTDIFVKRDPTGGWRLCTFNLHFGRAAYCLGSRWREMGDEAFLGWLEDHATLEEIAAFMRMVDAHWDPAALQDGDAAILEALGDKISRERRTP